MSYSQDILKASNIDVPWETLSGSNILVTGATGLIGSCIIEVLMAHEQRNYNVFAMGRNSERMNKLFSKFMSKDGFHAIIGDVTEELKYDLPFHFIIHAASCAAPLDFSSHPVEVMKANILGVSNLIEYGLRHELRRFLYVSSGEVYGEGDGRIFTEEYSGYVDSTSPRSCYPSSKRAAETLCVSYSAEYGTDVVIARPCHIYGPKFTENDNRVYAQFIRNILNDEDIIMKSTGSQYRSWCYVVDCVTALLIILMRGERGQAYNIADQTSNISIKELAEMIANLAGKKVVIELPSNSEKAGYNVVSRSVYSTDKLQSLGWSCINDFHTNIINTVSECQHFLLGNS